MRRSSRIRMRRRLALLGLSLGAALYALAATSVDGVRAEVTNNGLNCVATLNGFDVASLNSESTSSAIEVDKNGTVVVSVTANQPISSYHVDLAFSFRGWTVASDDRVNSTRWSNTINVKDYARFGIGLYRVTATSSGLSGSCDMAALVRVTGNAVPDSIAGDVGAGLAALGIGGLAGGIGKALGGDGGGGDGGSGGDGPGGPANEEVPTPLLPPDDDWCFPGFVMAVLMTVGFMAVGGGGAAPGGGGVAGGATLRRARWRPHIALIPILSGILGTVGGLVLLQQYGIVFPSLTVVILAFVAGLVVSVGLPSLARVVSVRRYNRRVARYERLMANRAARQQQAPPPPPPAPENPA
jgi:hypothetical protein